MRTTLVHMALSLPAPASVPFYPSGLILTEQSMVTQIAGGNPGAVSLQLQTVTTGPHPRRLRERRHVASLKDDECQESKGC